MADRVTARHPTRWMARGEHEIPSGEHWLTLCERERLDGMRFSKRRTEYLLRRWVGKQAVAVATGVPSDPAALARIEVANLRSGAPVVRVDGAPVGLEVSLTDRAGWAVCLLTETEAHVGCDLEIVERRSPGFVTDFLTAGEQLYLAARPDTDHDALANLLWSAKESALKVLRTGLRRDTRTVEVTVHEPPDADLGGWAPLDIRTAEGGHMNGWWRRDGVFLVTVAAEQLLLPPTPLPGSTDLRGARPVHSWVAQPLIP
jgi:4'-phosphopantetheinyl transferase